nr:immunoglobulin heavy chain junction region [Mus musculus]MBK4195176.1 immunoglobulin heavy chain junction region [Mus musculus]
CARLDGYYGWIYYAMAYW